MANNIKKHKVIRKAVQSVWGFLTNGYIPGFLKGTIYEGPLKRFCVPGMNCYSCPGALGACPIGAMQSLFDARRRKFAFYVVGFLATIGLLVGRFICGWLCLFGLIEEFLYMIPTPKIKVPEKIDKVLRYTKYVVLLVLVFLLPFFYRSSYGAGDPFFCKYLCPVGTLEGGIPLVLLASGMREAIGSLFRWKFAILIVCILSSIFIYRPFCKYLCPLGAFYALFQKVSILRLHFDGSACVNCGACSKVCKMNVNPVKNANSAECIRCGECVKACPKKALSFKNFKK
ncbi:4Fe-4S binding protein [Butyrivibrio fibrisolvens]|uniref:4Fe-4S binding protein n=1 Tax=Butyrivibrio fibrisolvens TaxID=831 RepID=UPI001FA906B6|nr:4Fe-4S binding protein [Butyrivibrio fibrisolvens]